MVTNDWCIVLPSDNRVLSNSEVRQDPSSIYTISCLLVSKIKILSSSQLLFKFLGSQMSNQFVLWATPFDTKCVNQHLCENGIMYLEI